MNNNFFKFCKSTNEKQKQNHLNNTTIRKPKTLINYIHKKHTNNNNNKTQAYIHNSTFRIIKKCIIIIKIIIILNL